MATNITNQVIEYLSKKGYSRTEAMLRMESANQDAEGRPYPRTDDTSAAKYGKAFGEHNLSYDPASASRRLTESHLLTDTLVDKLKRWIDESLEIYKVRVTAPSQPTVTV